MAAARRKYMFLFAYYENHDIRETEQYDNSIEIDFAIAAKRKLRESGINCYVDCEDGCAGGSVLADFEQVAADSRYLVLIMNKYSLEKFRAEENNVSNNLFHCELFRRITEVGNPNVFPILLDDFQRGNLFSLGHFTKLRFYSSSTEKWEGEHNQRSWNKLTNTGEKDLSQQIPLDPVDVAATEPEPSPARPSQLNLIDNSQVYQPSDGATVASPDRSPATSPDDASTVTSQVLAQVSEDSINTSISGYPRMTPTVGTGAQSASSTLTMGPGRSPSPSSPSTLTSGIGMDFDGTSSITSNTNTSSSSDAADQLDSISIQSEPFSPILGNTSSRQEQRPFTADSLHGQQGGGDSTLPGNSDAVDGERPETKSVLQQRGPSSSFALSTNMLRGTDMQTLENTGPSTTANAPSASVDLQLLENTNSANDVNVPTASLNLQSFGNPETELQGPESELQGPGSELQGPRAELQGPETELQGPGAELQGPGSELQGPRAELQGPRAELQGPETELQGPEAELQGLGSELQGPRAELQGPVAELQGPAIELQGAEAGLCGPGRQHEDIPNDAREPPSLSSLADWIGSTQEIRGLRQTYEELGVTGLFSYVYRSFHSTTDFSAYLSSSKHG